MSDANSDNTQDKHSGLVPWKPGESGNPKGRPKGSRNLLGEDFLKVLAADFEQHGKQVIETVRTNKPEVYLRIVADLLPKNFQMEIGTRPSDVPDDERRARILELLERTGWTPANGWQNPGGNA